MNRIAQHPLLRQTWAAHRTPLRIAPASLTSIHTSASIKDFHFDTHHFVQRLEREGLTRNQAEGIMASMTDVIEESIRNLTQNMVSKAQQEKVIQLQGSIIFNIDY